MRSRRNLLSSDQGAGDLWPSFTDVTSTIALILFVLVLLAFVRNLIAGKKLDAFQQQISASEQKLRRLGDELTRTTAQIELGQKQLTLSEQKLEEQQRVLAESNRELGDLRTRLQSIAVLRLDVLTKVKRSLEAALSATRPSAPPVAIGDNGNIVINESLVFEYNSFAIKKEGKPLLQTLSRALGNVLSDASVRENIDAVVIQGHTDERGPASFNRDLSSKRANAVLDFLFESNRALEEQFGSYFASSAFSEFRPINPAKSEPAYEQNRRIEISLVLKDANVRKVIDEYMQGSAPASPVPTGP
jgi:chemotaxis protein MotB